MNTSFLARRSVWFTWLPVIGIGAFIVLYLCAASMYPGGTRLDHHTRGYSHISNYWCDLLDNVSYSGRINRGRPFAILATIILPISLVPLWFQIQLLFCDGCIARWVVRIAGPASMMFSTLVFMPVHDLVINLASILGLVAFAATMQGLVGMRRITLVGIALVPTGLGIANYIMWQSGSYLSAMPIVQKASFVSFFIWIVAASWAISCELVADTGSGKCRSRNL